MEVETWKDMLDRLFEATNSSTEVALAARLGISSQSIYNAKKKKQIPPNWIFEVSKTFGVSSDWLFFGRGPMRPGEPAPEPQTPAEQPVIPTKTAEHCPRCERLEEKLEEMEKERREKDKELRELSAELRVVSAENRDLWIENGNLRVICATLEERQKTCCPEDIFKTTRATLPNEIRASI